MKKGITISLIAMLIVSLFSFVSCKEPEAPHEHVWVEIKSSDALRTSGSDTVKATYWKTCSGCGAHSDTEYFEGNYMPAAPTFSLAAGTFDEEKSVEITSAVAEAKIYYTTDGTTPTTSSELYSSAVTICADSTVKAIVVPDDTANYDPSEVASVDYKFNWNVYNKTTKTTYSTLTAAFSALAEGDEIVVNKDFQLTESTADTTKKSFILDLHGHTITSATGTSASGLATIKVRGTAASPVASVVIKNGTIIGDINGNQSSALIYFNYVDDIQLINLNILNEAHGTKMSNAVYNAYSKITINNTADNVILGRVIAYMNDSVAATQTEYVINGGTYNADTTTNDTASILVSDSKGASKITINDCVMNGTFVMATDAPTLKSSITINKGTFASDISLPKGSATSKIADFVPESSKVEKVSGKYVVTVK